MPPLSLTDQQLDDHVMKATKPLQPYHREAFLYALGSYFTGRQAISDGELKYAIRQLQREYFQVPKMSGECFSCDD
jgi:hypothetical protein